MLEMRKYPTFLTSNILSIPKRSESNLFSGPALGQGLDLFRKSFSHPITKRQFTKQLLLLKIKCKCRLSEDVVSVLTAE